MTAAQEIVRRDPASFGGGRAPALSQATAIEQSRAIAEVQAAVVVAQNCPRDMVAAEAEMEYVCGRLDMAEQAFYQVTNRGTGPSVHLARELARIWGNIDYGVKELHRDDQQGVSEVLSYAWDVQKNSRSSRTFINPHQRMKQGNRVELVDLQDIYLSNQNVGARAVRETIFTILPRWFVEKAQNLCRRTLEHGEGKPLADRIAALVNAFDGFGVTVQQLEARVDKPRSDWTPEDLAQLTVAGQSIRRGEVRTDDLFPPTEASSAADEIAPATPKPKARTTKVAKTNTDADNGETPDEKQQKENRDGDGDTNEVDNAGASDKPADPDPGPEPIPTPGKPQTPKRKALESRMFQLISAVRPKVRDDDRIDIYRAILGRPEVTTTDHLTDEQVGQVSNELYTWMKDGDIDAKVRDILMAADAKAAENEGTQQ